MGEKTLKGKILVVDDALASIDILWSALEGSGYEIIVATTGEKGIERAELTTPDLILLDVLMPGMDGFETCRRLKTQEKTREIPVIFMTALTDTESKVKGFEAGGVDYLTKPIEIEEVLARVRTHLALRNLRYELEVQNLRLLQEINEHNRAEGEVRKLNNELEHRVEERTLELSEVNEQLKEEIEERRQAEEALRESEERYRAVVEDMPAMICRFSLDGSLTFVNNTYSQYLGKQREDLIGKDIFQFIPRENREEVRKRLTALTREKPIMTHEHQVAFPNGSVRWQQWINRAIFDEEGHLKEFQSIGSDVTEIRAIREEKVKLERQLQQAQKMEALGTLAGGIAHDFNNILAIIMGCSELSLIEIPNETRSHRNLIEVLKAGERATDLVQQILTFSRQKKIERKPLQLSTLCKEILKMLRASLPSTIEIEQKIESSSGMALVDPTQIHQVLMNLCTNAAHAMGEKGGTLRVTLSNVDFTVEKTEHDPDLSPGPYIHLLVSDTGHGMTPDVMERIFDPYFTTKEPGEGTGLGLAVVHGIVKSYDGFIKVHSLPGKGSTFHVFLPRIVHEEDQKQGEEISELPKGNERVLFVDDEVVVTHMGEEILKYLGYQVVVANSGIEALEIFEMQSEEFHLVITDYIMPKMTGVDLTKEILRIRPEIPIIICTGYTDIMTLEKAKSLGIRKLIKKPLAMRAFAEEIREVLDQ